MGSIQGAETLHSVGLQFYFLRGTSRNWASDALPFSHFCILISKASWRSAATRASSFRDLRRIRPAIAAYRLKVTPEGLGIEIDSGVDEASVSARGVNRDPMRAAHTYAY